MKKPLPEEETMTAIGIEADSKTVRSTAETLTHGFDGEMTIVQPRITDCGRPLVSGFLR